MLRRYTLRIDGFVSLHAPLVGGELVTKPLMFTGGRLLLNVSTSAAGAVRVEMQDAGASRCPASPWPTATKSMATTWPRGELEETPNLSVVGGAAGAVAI